MDAEAAYDRRPKSQRFAIVEVDGNEVFELLIRELVSFYPDKN